MYAVPESLPDNSALIISIIGYVMTKFMKSLPNRRVTIAILSLLAAVSVYGGGPEKPKKCILVFGAHADDVELMAGGTFAKYISEGYEGVYVCVLNNFAGCAIESVGGGTTPPAGIMGPLFSISESPKSYPVGALESMQIRREESIRAAEVFQASPVFLDFGQGFIWMGRRRCYFGSDEYHQFHPPGRTVVSLAEIERGNVDYLVELLLMYSPEIVITHTLGGEKHDHGNSAYLMYLAFKKAMEKGVAVGELWMRPKGWLAEDKATIACLGKGAVHVNVKDHLGIKYEALNKHVSQTGIPRKQTRPEEITEDFIRVLVNTK